jgi:AraC-like DNA-binding protein
VKDWRQGVSFGGASEIAILQDPCSILQDPTIRGDRIEVHEQNDGMCNPSRMSPTDRLADQILALVPRNEFSPTVTPGLKLYAWDSNEQRMHLVVRPSLCVVLRGKKTAQVQARTFAYDPGRYFFSAVPLAAELILQRSTEDVLVGLVLELDAELVARVALEMKQVGMSAEADRGPPLATFTGELTPHLLGALERLVGCTTDPLRHALLHASRLREVIVELLMSPQGASLREAIRNQRSLRSLIEVMLYMEQHSAEPLSVPQLSSRAGMSVSAFYAKFRRFTGTTPLRYIKRLRLMKARVMLAAGADNVTAVAFSVGYASSPQFSREFRREFGCPPSTLMGR